MKIELDLNEVQAEELLVALSYRCKQDGIDEKKLEEIKKLGILLSRSFEYKFDWRDFNGKKRRVFEYLLEKKVKVKVRG